MASEWRAKAVAALALAMSVCVVLLIVNEGRGSSSELASRGSAETGGLAQLKIQLKAQERVQKEVEKDNETSEGKDDDKRGAEEADSASFQAKIQTLQARFKKSIMEAKNQEAAKIDQLENRFDHEKKKVERLAAHEVAKLKEEEKQKEQVFQCFDSLQLILYHPHSRQGTGGEQQRGRAQGRAQVSQGAH
eukprot:756190-Hanusia_phi.AAC.1